jgi:hypothetical protein
MSSIEAALAAIKSLKPGEKLVYTDIAAKYGVDRRTLARRHQCVTASCSTKAADQQALQPQQELELLQCIKQLTEQGLPPTQAMVRRFASDIAKRELGKGWIDRYIKRHNIHLISHWATGIDRSRHQADSQSKYSLYVELLRSKISQYNIEPCHMYNMDEKGFMLGVLTRSKWVFSRSMYEDGKMKAHIQDGSRKWITLLACICADGTALDPAIIYQSASSLLQDSWLQAFEPSNRVYFSSSSSGWTNNDIGLVWLKQVFDRSTKAKAQLSYRLLILDGHGSHLTKEYINHCDQNRILLMIYPPHSTHMLQPLDVVMFKPLSSAYSGEVAAFMERCQGLTSMSKRDFYPMFMTVWKALFKEDTILKAFEATGLSPFEPEVILKRFNKQPTQGSSSNSDSSALSASNWRKTESLIRQVVKDRGDPRAQKLSRAFH